MILKIWGVDEGQVDHGVMSKGEGGDGGLNPEALHLTGRKGQVGSSLRKEGKAGECGGLRARGKYVSCC